MAAAFTALVGVAAFPTTLHRPHNAIVEIKTPTGLGSGVEVEPGIIITARHVVADTINVTVIREDGTEVEGKVLWIDQKYDIGVVQITVDGNSVPSQLACSYVPRIGDQVEAVGNPLGVLFIHTWGRIAGLQAAMKGMGPEFSSPWASFFLTDLSISPGNSGGPLFDLRGRVLGLVVGILTYPSGPMGTSSPTGLSIVVPAADICNLLAQHEQAVS